VKNFNLNIVELPGEKPIKIDINANILKNLNKASESGINLIEEDDDEFKS
jgi:hypothetical protein